MLDIEKLQRRHPEKSLDEIIADYERHFTKRPEQEKLPPNHPYPPEGTGELFKKGKKKGS